MNFLSSFCSFSLNSSASKHSPKNKRSENARNGKVLSDFSITNNNNHHTNNLKHRNVCSLKKQSLSPPFLAQLLDSPLPANISEHVWNSMDKSPNITLSHNDSTFERNPVALSTDAVRSRQAYTQGIHVWRITWPRHQRGTHAVVGLSTSLAPLNMTGYENLVGSNEHSWGWDITRLLICHNAQCQVRYPNFSKFAPSFTVPKTFLVVLDMNRGTLGFIVKGYYLGDAFVGLKGKSLFLTASAVWGHCQVTVQYINGLLVKNLSLQDMCKHNIRKNLKSQNMKKVVKSFHIPEFLKYFILI